MEIGYDVLGGWGGYSYSIKEEEEEEDAVFPAGVCGRRNRAAPRIESELVRAREGEERRGEERRGEESKDVDR